jgi:hypothetical protein
MSKWKRMEEYKTSDNSNSESDVEEAIFAMNSKKGSRKNKGKTLLNVLIVKK